MGGGASAGLAAVIEAASDVEVKAVLGKIGDKDRGKLAEIIKSAGGVLVFGIAPSQNCMGPVLLAMEAGIGGLEMCDITSGAHLKPEFTAMNPFAHVPTLKDGGVTLGESNAILRYLALQYKSEYYPIDDPVACAVVDFAMDAFSNEVYPAHVKTIYTVMGFGSAPPDQEAANKAYNDALDTWTTHFLRGRFVGGDKLTIADFKALPFLFAAVQPGIIASIGLKVSDRVRQYVDDVLAAVKSSAMLKEAGGFSIAELIASKAPDAPKEQPAYEKAAYAETAELKPGGLHKMSGKRVMIYGATPSSNSMGPVLLAMEAGVGGLEACDVMNGAHKKPEFSAMNPFHHVPTMKDGDLAIGESSAILRYLARKYAPQYYPTAEPARCAIMDFAMDAFSGEVYPKHVPVVYVAMGFSAPPPDQAAANQSYVDAIGKWADRFLKGKFVGGDTLCIADFKVAPFFFAAVQPCLEQKLGFKTSDRIIKYCDDFCDKVGATIMLKMADGNAIAEVLASKAAA